MPDKRLLSIVDKLVARTQAGKTKWERDVSGDGFRTSYPDYSVTVTCIDLPFGPNNYKLLILDGEGNTVDSIILTSEDENLKELYELARRNARGVDKALDELLKFLSE